MVKVNIPTDIIIAPDNILGGTSGDNVAGPVSEQATDEKRILMSLSYGGSLYGRGSARATFFETDDTKMLANLSSIGGFTGKWLFSIDDHSRFVGFLTNMTSQRVQGGNVRTYEFSDVLQAWDVLLTNQVYSESTVHLLLNDIVYSALTISGVPLHGGHVPDNSTLLSDLFENGQYIVTNSTYLSEIQKICQDLGYLVFCDVGFGDVAILDAFNLNRSVIELDTDYLIDAQFNIDYLSMYSTVLVNDDQSLKGVAYGQLGTGSNYNPSVYGFTRINNLLFATTSGVKEEALPGIAQKLYTICRYQPQVLTVRKAGDEYSSLALGSDLNWTDTKGNTGTYTIFEYNVELDPTHYETTFKAHKKIA